MVLIHRIHAIVALLLVALASASTHAAVELHATEIAVLGDVADEVTVQTLLGGQHEREFQPAPQALLRAANDRPA
ncbi:MAG: hypothetical protein ABW187_04690 [Dokdonella sp.]